MQQPEDEKPDAFAEFTCACDELQAGGRFTEILIDRSFRWNGLFGEIKAKQMLKAFESYAPKVCSHSASPQAVYNLFLILGNANVDNSKDNSTNVNGMGNVVSGGEGYIAEFKDVNISIQHMQQLPFTDEVLRAAFVAALKDIESSSIADLFKGEAKRACEKLAEEATKPKPDKSVLKHFLGSIPDVAKAIGGVASLIPLISKLF